MVCRRINSMREDVCSELSVVRCQVLRIVPGSIRCKGSCKRPALQYMFAFVCDSSDELRAVSIRVYGHGADNRERSILMTLDVAFEGSSRVLTGFPKATVMPLASPGSP